MEQSIDLIGGGRITKKLLKAFQNRNVRFDKLVVSDLNIEVLVQKPDIFTTSRRFSFQY
jgi:predicted dinucleotide-utilizing enzyme